jgi:hypothetical protein
LKRDDLSDRVLLRWARVVHRSVILRAGSSTVELCVLPRAARRCRQLLPLTLRGGDQRHRYLECRLPTPDSGGWYPLALSVVEVRPRGITLRFDASRPTPTNHAAGQRLLLYGDRDGRLTTMCWMHQV